jgi:hypothetical protein
MSNYEVYLSFEEVPLDDKPTWEGDDSLHGIDLGAGDAALLTKPPPTLALPPKMAKLVVPHPRDLKRKMVGWDVLALHRALAKSGFHDWNLSNVKFGPVLEKDVRRFQTRHKLTVDGVYGLATHHKLAPYYDSYGIALISKQPVETPLMRAQRLFLASAMALYNMKARVHYTQGSARMYIVKHKIHTVADLSDEYAVWEDCSSSSTGLYYMAGAPDPNGFDYNGLGYTGTLALRGRATTTKKSYIGTLGFYGRYPYKHVTGVVAVPRTNPLRVISHGSESGPYLLEIDYRSDFAHVRNYKGMAYS